MSPRQAMAVMAAPVLIVGALALAIHVADSRAMREYEPLELRTHVIRPGDTLWQIAREQYPEADPRAAVYAIRGLNEWADPGRLRPGRILVLPEEVR